MVILRNGHAPSIWIKVRAFSFSSFDTFRMVPAAMGHLLVFWLILISEFTDGHIKDDCTMSRIIGITSAGKNSMFVYTKDGYVTEAQVVGRNIPRVHDSRPVHERFPQLKDLTWSTAMQRNGIFHFFTRDHRILIFSGKTDKLIRETTVYQEYGIEVKPGTEIAAATSTGTNDPNLVDTVLLVKRVDEKKNTAHVAFYRNLTKHSEFVYDGYPNSPDFPEADEGPPIVFGYFESFRDYRAAFGYKHHPFLADYSAASPDIDDGDRFPKVLGEFHRSLQTLIGCPEDLRYDSTPDATTHHNDPGPMRMIFRGDYYWELPFNWTQSDPIPAPMFLSEATTVAGGFSHIDAAFTLDLHENRTNIYIIKNKQLAFNDYISWKKEDFEEKFKDFDPTASITGAVAIRTKHAMEGMYSDDTFDIHLFDSGTKTYQTWQWRRQERLQQIVSTKIGIKRKLCHLFPYVRGNFTEVDLIDKTFYFYYGSHYITARKNDTHISLSNLTLSQGNLFQFPDRDFLNQIMAGLGTLQDGLRKKELFIEHKIIVDNSERWTPEGTYLLTSDPECQVDEPGPGAPGGSNATWTSTTSYIKDESKIIPIVGIALGIIILLIIFVVVYCCFRKKKEAAERKPYPEVNPIISSGRLIEPPSSPTLLPGTDASKPLPSSTSKPLKPAIDPSIVKRSASKKKQNKDI